MNLKENYIVVHQKKEVAIVIVNWNSYKDTYECLCSLELLEYKKFTVYLVDNDSKDGSFEKLKLDYKNEKFPFIVRFIKNKSNLGFAGGNNKAIHVARQEGIDYIWMLNNDTVVTSSTLTHLVQKLESDKKIGIVGSKIFYHSSNKIWFAGGKFNSFIGKPEHIGINKEDNQHLNQLNEVDYITGCSLLFDTKIIDYVGLMSEDYFLYYEETDWNIRVRKNGWKIVIEPKSIVFHKVSMSSGGNENISPYFAYYDIRNSYIVIKRNYSKIKAIMAYIYSIIKGIKYFLKVIILRQDRFKERCWYIFMGLTNALKESMGKHPDY